MQLQRGDGRRHRPIVMAATRQDNRSPALPDICLGCSAQVALHGGSRQGVRISRSSSSARSPGAASLPCGRWRPRERPGRLSPRSGPDLPQQCSAIFPDTGGPACSAPGHRHPGTQVARRAVAVPARRRGGGPLGAVVPRPLPDAGEMAVPASFNDIAADAAVHDHFGDVWYQTRCGCRAAGTARGSCCTSSRRPTGPRCGWTTPRSSRHEGGYTPSRPTSPRTCAAGRRGADHRRW